MALVKFGGGVAAMQGAIGGTVFARNRGGAYARAWAKPTNEPTPIQTTRRSGFAAISAAWSALPEGSREIWEGDASALVLPNRLGEDYTPSGRQFFMSVNQNQQLSGQALLDLPATGTPPPIIDDLATITCEQIADEISVFDLTLTDWTTDSILLIQIAPPQLTGKVNLGLLYRQALVIPADTTIDLVTAFTDLYGTNFPSEAVVKIRMRAIGFETGFSSPSLIVETQVI